MYVPVRAALQKVIDTGTTSHMILFSFSWSMGETHFGSMDIVKWKSWIDYATRR
jgi:hypothetical protein